MRLWVKDNSGEFLREVAKMFRDVRDGLDLVVSDACEDGADEARRVVPRKTGALADSITGRWVSRGQGEIAARSPYALYVEDDTKPHEIRARRAKALHWQEGGADRFARAVQHPGTKGQPFMGPAHNKAERVLWARGEVLLAKVARQFRGAA